ncbi:MULTISPECIES: tellurite resistance TerB family protein [unclassified Janthinobacterium]|uniref:tellurite resistance TerB family protein n=1 Tax=unclassified Janthinobacterium TaxID=2610881 RepID=UPI0008F4B42A|nr:MULTISPECIES: TerB family tellurite resistance protein [unclassified Janthinobacterium]APA69448.1 hypothetical protein YQ44_18555 [Janthinobacterium sp. 1_2014MBL_MicDiv]MDN2712645.1 TerB family tellurite resistance protein [Janthinobacterium sp. SUN118]
MRTYSVNSPQAAGRILALMMIVDGNLDSSELQALHSSKILEHIDLEPAAFQQLLQDLCDDMLTSTVHGAIQLGHGVIDSLLEEISDPDLRRKLLHAMWKIADADDWLADGEAVLLSRAGAAWSAETNFRRHAA